MQRPITLHTERLQGKWLLNRRHGRPYVGLNDALLDPVAYVNRDLHGNLHGLGAHGSYDGDIVETL